jgi:hypothetical protein
MSAGVVVELPSLCEELTCSAAADVVVGMATFPEGKIPSFTGVGSPATEFVVEE